MRKREKENAHVSFLLFSLSLLIGVTLANIGDPVKGDERHVREECETRVIASGIPSGGVQPRDR